MLRAVRFAANLDFRIEEETWKAIQENAPAILEVSWERIFEELDKMLTGPNPAGALRLLEESLLLERILPEVTAMRGVAQPPEFHPEGDVWQHTLLCFEKAKPPLSRTLAFAVLLHDVGKPGTYEVADRIRFNSHDRLGAEMAEKICKRLKMSNGDTEKIVELVKDHLKFMNINKMRESTLKRFLVLENFPEHLELHRIDCSASHGMMENIAFCEKKLEDSRPYDLPEF